MTATIFDWVGVSDITLRSHIVTTAIKYSTIVVYWSKCCHAITLSSPLEKVNELLPSLGLSLCSMSEIALKITLLVVKAKGTIIQNKIEASPLEQIL